MTTATALALRVAERCHDSAQAELSAAQYLAFINDALEDLAGAGWLEPQVEDESLTLAENDYDYNVPSGFAYIQSIYVADSDSEFPSWTAIPQHQWRISLDVATTPEIYFFPDVFDMLLSGRAIKLIGQKRPSTGVAGAATIVGGMEAFVRERGVAYAAEFLASGVSERQQSLQRLADSAWAKSQQMLANHPQEYRVWPNSVYVEGR